jgi:AbrB family looped-hinge helix DNA binding protein
MMRITSKGQVTIPAEIREKAGLLPETEVEFAYDGKTVTLRPIRRGRNKRPDRGERLIAHLRTFRSKVTMTTDEIMALTRDE